MMPVHPIVYDVDPKACPSPETEKVNVSSDGANQRRSTRLLLAVPVILSGKDASGEKFREECRTTFINRQGASISVSRIIAPGAELLIENPPLGITVRARAIRFIERTVSGGLHQVAVELIDLKNVWGIQYPPRDWQRSIPLPAKVEKAKPSPAAETVEIELTPTLSPSPAPPQPAFLASPPVSTPIPVAGPPLPAHSGPSPEKAEIPETYLAKMAADIDAQLQSSLHDALEQLEAKRSDLCAFEERLTSLAQVATGACTSLEGLLSRAEETGRQTREETEAIAQRLRQAEEQRTQVVQEVERRMALASQSTLERFAGELREFQSVRALLNSQAKEEIQFATRTGLENFRAELQRASSQACETAVSSVARSAAETENQRAKALEEVQLAVRAELENFQAELQRASRQAREEAVSSAARSAAETESQRAKALETMQAQTGAATRASLEAFRAELQQQAQAFRDSLLPELARQAAAQSATEFERARDTFSAQAKEEVQFATRTELENFRAELQRASSQACENAVSSVARSAVETESQRAKVLETIQSQAAEATRASLETFRAELQQQVQAFRDSLLPELARQAAAQSATEFDAARAELGVQAKEEIQLATHAELENFQAELENRARQFEQRALALLEQPAHEIAKYAGDTLLMAREEADALRKSFIEGTHTQLDAITRGTLASMTGESKALTEEYRTQLRAAFESIKEKSAAGIKSDIQETLEQGRESALRQLQKDAEDFSAVAVGQFRGKSDEAIREASDAVNKQVGAAAFVVKEWLDQATQRLESYIGRMEKQSDAAVEAIQNRSCDLAQATLEGFRKESETLLLSLRQRIQNASDALISSLPDAGQLESETSARPAFEDAPARSARPLE